MRNLQVGKYYPPYKGGMETALRHICEGLLAQGHEVRAVVAGGGARTWREPLGDHADALASVATWGAWNSQPLTLTLAPVLAREMDGLRARRGPSALAQSWCLLGVAMSRLVCD